MQLLLGLDPSGIPEGEESCRSCALASDLNPHKYCCRGLSALFLLTRRSCALLMEDQASDRAPSLQKPYLCHATMSLLKSYHVISSKDRASIHDSHNSDRVPLLLERRPELFADLPRSSTTAAWEDYHICTLLPSDILVPSAQIDMPEHQYVTVTFHY